MESDALWGGTDERFPQSLSLPFRYIALRKKEKIHEAELATLHKLGGANKGRYRREKKGGRVSCNSPFISYGTSTDEEQQSIIVK